MPKSDRNSYETPSLVITGPKRTKIKMLMVSLIEYFLVCTRIYMRVYSSHPRLLNISLVCRSQIMVNGTILVRCHIFVRYDINYGTTDRNIPVPLVRLDFLV